MTTALVTGASAGIGAAFCRELARTGHDVVLVARSAEALETLAAQLRASHGVSTEVLVADLANRADVERVAERLRLNDAHTTGIDLLVNNAGFGLRDSFLSGDLAQEERAVDVMCRAVLVLCHAAGRSMRDRGRGSIVNVSSVAGFTAMNSYAALKAWVTTFSEALAAELAGTGVTVTAVCPGFTRSEFHRRAGLDVSALPAAVWLNTDDVAKAGLADAARGKIISVPGALYKVLTATLTTLPRPLVRAASGIARSRRRPASPRPT